jgi:hypothetical protein
MVEVLSARELEYGDVASLKLVPQMQVTLSRRQHVGLEGGVSLPLNTRAGHSSAVVVALLWDWFEGGLFSGWTGK